VSKLKRSTPLIRWNFSGLTHGPSLCAVSSAYSRLPPASALERASSSAAVAVPRRRSAPALPRGRVSNSEMRAEPAEAKSPSSAKYGPLR
jgi:hypothetical protein